MQAYEFYAVPENGTIRIPKQFEDKVTSGVKVILLDTGLLHPDKRHDKLKKSDKLLPPTAITEGWSFHREEANER